MYITIFFVPFNEKIGLLVTLKFGSVAQLVRVHP